jgi:hypothetical protein
MYTLHPRSQYWDVMYTLHSQYFFPAIIYRDIISHITSTYRYTLHPSTSLQMPNIELHRPGIEPGPPLIECGRSTIELWNLYIIWVC